MLAQFQCQMCVSLLFYTKLLLIFRHLLLSDLKAQREVKEHLTYQSNVILKVNILPYTWQVPENKYAYFIKAVTLM